MPIVVCSHRDRYKYPSGVTCTISKSYQSILLSQLKSRADNCGELHLSFSWSPKKTISLSSSFTSGGHLGVFSRYTYFLLWWPKSIVGHWTRAFIKCSVGLHPALRLSWRSYDEQNRKHLTTPYYRLSLATKALSPPPSHIVLLKGWSHNGCNMIPGTSIHQQALPQRCSVNKTGLLLMEEVLFPLWAFPVYYT